MFVFHLKVQASNCPQRMSIDQFVRQKNRRSPKTFSVQIHFIVVDTATNLSEVPSELLIAFVTQNFEAPDLISITLKHV